MEGFSKETASVSLKGYGGSGRADTHWLRLLVVVLGGKKEKVLRRRRLLNMSLFKKIDELKLDRDKPRRQPYDCSRQFNTQL